MTGFWEEKCARRCLSAAFSSYFCCCVDKQMRLGFLLVVKSGKTVSRLRFTINEEKTRCFVRLYERSALGGDWPPTRMKLGLCPPSRRFVTSRKANAPLAFGELGVIPFPPATPIRCWVMRLASAGEVTSPVPPPRRAWRLQLLNARQADVRSLFW